MAGTSQPKRVSLSPGIGGANLNVYDEKNAVASGVEITIVEYTVPVGKDFYLTLAEYFGENVADYKLLIDNNKEADKSTYYTRYEGEFFFHNLPIAAGIKIELKARHLSSDPCSFKGRILGRLVDA